MSEPAIIVDSVSKNFRLYHERNRYIKAAILRGRRAKYEEFWALDDVSFEVEHGSTLGIIGSNGSGKSTMLKCLTGIYRPDKGKVSINGNIAALLELGAGFHPELSGRENVYLNAAILGLSKKDAERQFDSIVEFAGLERFIDTAVKNYSSGMVIRLGFSVAAHVEPEILLIDEVLTPDSSRFWPADSYAPGHGQPSFDKQPLRDWLDVERRAGRWNGDAPAPVLPSDVIRTTSLRYRDAFTRLTGAPLDLARLGLPEDSV